MACFEQHVGINLPKERALDLILKALNMFGEELALPSARANSYLVNFQNKHLFIFPDGSYEMEDPNPDYYLRFALPVEYCYED